MTQEPLTLYKLIVLYMINKVNFNLNYSQISNFMLEKEYTNYMTLQQVISDLQDTGLIEAETLGNRTYFSITAEGQNTLSCFINRIGAAIIKDVDTFLLEKHYELKDEASVTANYYIVPPGRYEVDLVAKENDMNLINIKLSVPTEDMAQTVSDSWYKKNQQIYKYLMEELF